VGGRGNYAWAWRERAREREREGETVESGFGREGVRWAEGKDGMGCILGGKKY